MTKRLLPAKAVRARFGGCSTMTLWRYLQDESLGFPQPVFIRKRRYWDADEVEAFIDRQALNTISKHAA